MLFFCFSHSALVIRWRVLGGAPMVGRSVEDICATWTVLQQGAGGAEASIDLSRQKEVLGLAVEE